MSKVYNWGIIGAGKIANKFAEALKLIEGVKLFAVASRDVSRAEQFAIKHDCGRYYDSYETLISDENIDVIYIATPHAFHCELTINCLQHGKAVLCEKPLALNATQVSAMIEASNKHHSFLMEALWTRLLPWMQSVNKIVNEEQIGVVKYVRADFGFSAQYDPSGRLFDLQLGGGSLLDVGIYPLFLCMQLLGKPDNVIASANIAASGADWSCHAILQYNNGSAGIISSMLDCETPQTAEIAATQGMIRIPSRWHRVHSFEWKRTDEQWQKIELEPFSNGFEFQIKEVVVCLENGLIESPSLPHCFSLDLAETMDKIRAQIGVKYHGE